MCSSISLSVLSLPLLGLLLLLPLVGLLLSRPLQRLHPPFRLDGSPLHLLGGGEAGILSRSVRRSLGVQQRTSAEAMPPHRLLPPSDVEGNPLRHGPLRPVLPLFLKDAFDDHLQVLRMDRVGVIDHRLQLAFLKEATSVSFQQAQGGTLVRLLALVLPLALASSFGPWTEPCNVVANDATVKARLPGRGLRRRAGSQAQPDSLLVDPLASLPRQLPPPALSERGLANPRAAKLPTLPRWGPCPPSRRPGDSSCPPTGCAQPDPAPHRRAGGMPLELEAAPVSEPKRLSDPQSSPRLWSRTAALRRQYAVRIFRPNLLRPLTVPTRSYSRKSSMISGFQVRPSRILCTSSANGFSSSEVGSGLSDLAVTRARVHLH